MCASYVNFVGIFYASSLGRGVLCASVCMFYSMWASAGGFCVYVLFYVSSRCFVFRQGGSVCVCVYVLFYVNSRCFVFRQSVCVCVYVLFYVFRQGVLCVCSILCELQDASSLGRVCMFYSMWAASSWCIYVSSKMRGLCVRLFYSMWTQDASSLGRWCFVFGFCVRLCVCYVLFYVSFVGGSVCVCSILKMFRL